MDGWIEGPLQRSRREDYKKLESPAKGFVAVTRKRCREDK
ncbi:unnamed protein product [Amoebophrya sp. A25]|nr:unnamed protein product [Amoebophrya sp. A25]|eukprot:GSA25T00006299001.1